MQKSLTTKNHKGDSVIDLIDLAGDVYEDDDKILELVDIAFPAKQKSSLARRIVTKVNAPDMQILARCALPLLIAAYFLLIEKPPILLSLPALLIILLLFPFYHIHKYKKTKGRKSESDNFNILSANQIDLLGAHLTWLIDPLEPSPMMMLVVIVTIGNGLQHGYASFQNVLNITVWASPLTFLLRVYLIGTTLNSTGFLIFCAFLVGYCFILIGRSDRIQAMNESRTTHLELNNYKLKQLGMALQKSEMRYRNIFDNSTAAMVLLDNDMRIALVNARFEKLTRYTKSEIYDTKKKLSDIIDQDDLDRILRISRRRDRLGAAPFEYECKLKDKLNNTKYVIIRFNNTQWHERIMATIEDISIQKQARLALLKSNKKLRQTFALLSQSEKSYRNLFENTGTATILVGKNMRINMVNTKFTELTGYDKNEIIGKIRLSELIERRNLFRIRRFQIKQKKKGLPLPTEYECLMIDKFKNMKYVVMKTYSPPEQDISIVSFFDITERKRAEAALQEAHERLRLLSTTDELTQVANRRHFNERLTGEWNRLKREGLPLSLILCDVDYFKLFNDTYGHQLGDKCLQAVATAIVTTVKRSADLVARYGGEEFTVLMPNTDIFGATQIAEAARLAISNLQMPHEASQVARHVTLSLGVSTMIPSHLHTPDALIKDADNALYEAKRQGRNRVVIGDHGRQQMSGDQQDEQIIETMGTEE